MTLATGERSKLHTAIRHPHNPCKLNGLANYKKSGDHARECQNSRIGLCAMGRKALSPHGVVNEVFRSPVPLSERLTEEAARRGVSRSALLRELVAEGLGIDPEAAA